MGWWLDRWLDRFWCATSERIERVELGTSTSARAAYTTASTASTAATAFTYRDIIKFLLFFLISFLSPKTTKEIHLEQDPVFWDLLLQTEIHPVVLAMVVLALVVAVRINLQNLLQDSTVVLRSCSLEVVALVEA